MKTNLWLTVLTIALVLNAVMMQNKLDGDDCTSGIRKEHLDPIPGHFVDGQTIQIGTNGLEAVNGFEPDIYEGQQSITFPNGLILKFGRALDGPTSVSFDSAFNHGAMSVIATANAWSPTVVTVRSLTLGGFEIVDNGPTAAIDWVAIGY